MKKVLILVFAIVLTLCVSSVAYAAGYNNPYGDLITVNPHGGYASTTNKCKTCHAVHLAEGPFRLLRGTSAADECDYCHGLPGAHTSLAFDPTNWEGHTMGWPDTSVGGPGGTRRPPDDSDSTTQLTFSSTNQFRCGACHSPHDNDTVILEGESESHLLKKDPDPYESKYWTGSGDMSKWCSDCHSANYGLHTDAKTISDPDMPDPTKTTRYGHDSFTDGPHVGATYPCAAPNGCHGDPGSPSAVPNFVDADDSVNKGPTCQQCHQAGDDAQGYFPHTASSTSKDLLKDSAYSGGKDLDEICTDCHFTPSLP